MIKNPPASAGDVRDTGSIPGLGRSPGGEHGNPLQYSCLENPMDRGAWRATVHGVTKSRTQLEQLSNHSTSLPKKDLRNIQLYLDFPIIWIKPSLCQHSCLLFCSSLFFFSYLLGSLATPVEWSDEIQSSPSFQVIPPVIYSSGTHW